MTIADPNASSPDQRLRDAVREPASLRFIEAWLGWRGSSRLMPPRTAMDIGDIRELLDAVMLFELNGPDDIRIRVAGTRFRHHANFEATGRNLIELTPPALWPIRRYRMHAMAQLPCAGAMTTFDRETIGAGITIESVTLPIDADQPGGSRLLISCLTPVGGAYEPPAPSRRQYIVLADQFAFVDIGAGRPERTEP